MTIIIKSALNSVIDSFNKGNLIIKFIKTNLQGFIGTYNNYNNLKSLY